MKKVTRDKHELCETPKARGIRRWLGAVSVSAIVAGASACDGGGGFAAAADVRNDCEEPVRATISNTYSLHLDSPDPERVQLINPGETYTLNNAILKPTSATIFLYVVDEDADAFAYPTELDVADLPMKVVDGYDAYGVVVSGEACPKP